VPSELQNTGPTSLYWNSGGVYWPALIAQVVGMFAAISALSATFHLPQWLNEVTYHNNGADFSIFLGMGVGGAAYYLLAHAKVAREADSQTALLTEEGLLPA
jgi:cytosine/uracil/thiamine/allantoin permease